MVNGGDSSPSNWGIGARCPENDPGGKAGYQRWLERHCQDLPSTCQVKKPRNRHFVWNSSSGRFNGHQMQRRPSPGFEEGIGLWFMSLTFTRNLPNLWLTEVLGFSHRIR
jgi:hypothetical protein